MATTTPTSESGNWDEQKRKLHSKFSSLTDADLQYEESRRELMLTLLQIKLGKTRDELNEIISSL